MNYHDSVICFSILVTYCTTLVCRAIIYKYDFQLLIGLFYNAFYTFFQVSCNIIYRYNNADFSLHMHFPYFTNTDTACSWLASVPDTDIASCPVVRYVP